MISDTTDNGKSSAAAKPPKAEFHEILTTFEIMKTLVYRHKIYRNEFNLNNTIILADQ